MTASVYTYQDFEFDIADGVFQSTETTAAIMDVMVKHFEDNPPSPDLHVLDLGCGCGVIGIVMAKKFGIKSLCASDISDTAIRQAGINAKKYGVDIDFRSGSLFDPWKGNVFDVVIDDISGVAEPIARLSDWYPPNIPCATGDDGTALIARVLQDAPAYMKADGLLFFPVLTLSDETRILSAARAQFRTVETMADRRWFLYGKLLENREKFWPLVEAGKIGITEVKGRYMWHTKVYRASNRG